MTREAIRAVLEHVCERVSVEVAKSVLKQAAVQHLYGRLSGRTRPGVGDAALLAALHPTPAVCGRPREQALRCVCWAKRFPFRGQQCAKSTATPRPRCPKLLLKNSPLLPPTPTKSLRIPSLLSFPLACCTPSLLESEEPFDRGYYSGPFGWVSGQAAEFVVAIRSALLAGPAQDLAAAAPSNGSSKGSLASTQVSRLSTAWHASRSWHVAGCASASQCSRFALACLAGPWRPALPCLPPLHADRPPCTPHCQVYTYAGVGVVPGSNAELEWQELQLKVRQFEALLAPRPALSALPNINAAWAALAVEELCRLGANTFCVAPGE